MMVRVVVVVAVVMVVVAVMGKRLPPQPKDAVPFERVCSPARHDPLTGRRRQRETTMMVVTVMMMRLRLMCTKFLV